MALAASSKTERLRSLLAQILVLTTEGKIQWTRQMQSAHRYARWKNNLLILGPDLPLEDKTPRYLFVTPFDSPDCIEVSSDDAQLGEEVFAIVRAVEAATAGQPTADPFDVNEQLISSLTAED
jgi:hypothetical protein